LLQALGALLDFAQNLSLAFIDRAEVTGAKQVSIAQHYYQRGFELVRRRYQREELPLTAAVARSPGKRSFGRANFDDLILTWCARREVLRRRERSIAGRALHGFGLCQCL